MKHIVNSIINISHSIRGSLKRIERVFIAIL